MKPVTLLAIPVQEMLPINASLVLYPNIGTLILAGMLALQPNISILILVGILVQMDRLIIYQ